MSRRELSTIVARAKALRSAPRAKPSIQLPVRHPVDLPDVAAVVAARLESELNVGPLRVTEGPTEEPHGWEAHVYRFRIQRLANLPPPYDGPLGLRAYDTPHALTRAQHEFEVMRAVQASGYPAPRPLLLEEDCRLLGGPFLILPWANGITLLEWLRRGFWRILSAAGQLADLHLALHDLPLIEPLAPANSFLDRRLGEIETMIDDYDLVELAPGLDWLCCHRPGPASRPCLLHLDFHPANVIVAEDRPQAVVDWSEADAGDRHADVAMTLVLMRTAPLTGQTAVERLFGRPARWWLATRYMRVYRRSAPLDPGLLRYYVAWAALRRLAVCGVWRRAGPWVHGFKTSAVQHANSSHEESLRRAFQRATAIRLAEAPAGDLH
ncbi:MAG TPA: phosphotransferase [Gemmataceae bacterium]|nr:phosphotransferase [Gemmataceae bacterium]